MEERGLAEAGFGKEKCKKNKVNVRRIIGFRKVSENDRARANRIYLVELAMIAEGVEESVHSEIRQCHVINGRSDLGFDRIL
jgi:hypothetical protein